VGVPHRRSNVSSSGGVGTTVSCGATPRRPYRKNQPNLPPGLCIWKLSSIIARTRILSVENFDVIVGCKSGLEERQPIRSGSPLGGIGEGSSDVGEAIRHLTLGEKLSEGMRTFRQKAQTLGGKFTRGSFSETCQRG
jgi:hypothetical protein